MSDYVAKVKIQNGRIHRLMIEHKITNQAELARLAGCTASQVGEIMNFKELPMTADGEWRLAVTRIADVFGCLPDELFSPEQLTMQVPTNKRDYLISHDDVMRIAAEREAPLLLEQDVDSSLLRDFIAKTLDVLTPRRRRVVAMHFGLDGYEEMTYEEIGAKENITGQRVRQIVEKSLRLLREPRVASQLWSATRDEDLPAEFAEQAEEIEEETSEGERL